MLPTMPLLSAQVILRGNPPPAEMVRATPSFFAHCGFTVGEFVGISFSITASRDVFERTFLVTLGKDLPEEIPLKALPGEFQAAILAVAFPGKPDFGPFTPVP